jgi:hypothetical protein
MSDAAPPILCVFKDGVFTPARSSAVSRAQRFYREGAEYALVEYQARSRRAHNFYFAAVEDAFRNLPEEWAQEFPTVEHLRKFCLIKTGFHHCDTIVCPDAASAERLVALARPMDEYGIVTSEGNVVRRFKAKSQSPRSMDRTEFRASADAVLDLLAKMIGTTRRALEHNAESAA